MTDFDLNLKIKKEYRLVKAGGLIFEIIDDPQDEPMTVSTDKDKRNRLAFDVANPLDALFLWAVEKALTKYHMSVNFHEVENTLRWG